jgi:hypothetical protein
VVPNFVSCELYVPLNTSKAFWWYFETIYTAWTFRQWLLQPLVSRLASCGGFGFAPLIPCFALTAVSPPHPRETPSVLGVPSLPRGLGQEDLHPVLIRTGGDRVVVLPFTRPGSTPVAVLKVPRLPAFNGRTENEQGVLSELRAILSPELLATLPEPWGILPCGAISIGIEAYAPGRSLLRACGTWGTPIEQKIRDLRMAAAWLGEFHRQVQVRCTEWGAQSISEWVEQPLAAYHERFGTEAEARLFTAARQHAETLRGLPLPVVWQHRDFSLSNLLRRGSTLSVLDWEGARPGPALCDLLHFVTLWNEVVHRAADDAERIRVFSNLFIDSDHTSRAVAAARDAIAVYLRQLHLDPRFVPLLLVYTWVELVLRRDEQLQLRDGVSHRDRGENRNATYMIPLSQHSTELFGARADGDDDRHV